MIPSEQSADLRDYYAKHINSDRLDSKILARIPSLHPEGFYAHEHLGPAVPIRRATRLRSSLVKRRSDHFGAPGRIRTCDARFRKPTLYPLSYGGGIL
jgi:hypothetical protein